MENMYNCHAPKTSMDVNIPQLTKEERMAPHEILPNDERRYMRARKQSEMRDANMSKR
jgi:hypothetical protein